MKKLGLFVLIMFTTKTVLGVPSNTMSVAPAAVDAAIIQASDENTRNNAIVTTYNAHTHNDKAETNLDNLSSVAINTSLISDTDNTDDLGSSSKEWKDLYIDGTAYIDGMDASCRVDGNTTGHGFEINQGADVLAAGKSALRVVSTATQDQTSSYLVYVNQDGAGSDQAAMYINNDGTGTGLTVVQNGSAGAIYSAGRGVQIMAASTNNEISNASVGSGSVQLYVGNDDITMTFTGKHYYKLGDTNLKAGELVKLVDNKIYRSTDSQDPKAIGIYQGIPRWEDSLGNVCVVHKEENGKWKDKPAKKNDKTKDAEKEDFAYSVATVGDSYSNHDKYPIKGAYVTTDAGIILAGDLLCASDRDGYLEKQTDDLVHSYTVGKATHDITSNTKKAYIYLLQ